MELRPGYKRTEIGMIPEDWSLLPLGSVGKWFSGGTPSMSIAEYWVGDIPWVSPKDMKSLWLHDSIDHITPKAVADGARLVPAGAILIVIRGMILAHSFPVARAERTLSFNQDIKAVITGRDVKSCFFLYWLTANARQIRSLTTESTHGTKRLPTEVVFRKLVACPPVPEQEAIAEALGDADALIKSLEQLLVKKRQIKQGAMQELLRPKPDNENKLLRDISSLKGRIGWQGLKQAEFTTNEDEPFLITGMNFKDGAIRWSEVYHISKARYEMAPEIQLRANDVLMTKDGTIGKVLYIDTIPYPGKASLNSHLLLLRPIRGSYNPKYLYYQLSSQRFKDFIELNKSGTTFFGLSQAAAGAYPVFLPSMEEQVRIAWVLSDLDAEIAALEAKLAKARQVKQGMMQELLTGRIRLV